MLGLLYWIASLLDARSLSCLYSADPGLRDVVAAWERDAPLELKTNEARMTALARAVQGQAMPVPPSFRHVAGGGPIVAAPPMSAAAAAGRLQPGVRCRVGEPVDGLEFHGRGVWDGGVG